MTALEPGKPIERILTGGEAHRYKLNLQKAHCAVIHVEQRGIDVAVQVLRSDSDLVAEADDEISKNGTEKLEIVADHDDVYTIAVKPKSKVSNGEYEIRLVEVRTATRLDRTLFEVRQLRTKANRLVAADKQQEALPLAQQALTLAQEALGLDDAYVALLMKDVADITLSRKPAEAKAIFERALQVLTLKLGAEHSQTLDIKSRLGKVCVDLEDFSKADQLLTQALESEEKTLGRDDPLLVATLRSLGILRAERGDFAAAEHEFQRALTILERMGATEEIQYGQLLNGLGVISIHQSEFSKAESYLQRALAFREKKFGPQSLAVSDVLQNLGVVAHQTKDNPAAEKYYLRMLAIREKYLEPGHIDYANGLVNLANVYCAEGNYQKALEMALRELRILEQTSELGDRHRVALRNIAKIYAALGDFENANKVQAQLQSALESHIALNIAFGAERQKVAYLNHDVAQWTDQLVSLNLQLEPSNSQATAIAATVLLQRKGRVLDAMTDTLGALRKHSDPQDQALLDKLKEATTQFARLALQGPQKQSPDEHRKALYDLRERKEKLENTISHHNEEFRARFPSVTLEAIQSAIPADSALLEFVIYRPFNPKAQTSEEELGDPRYGVYVLHGNAAPKGVDLGDAKAIDGAVESLRAALRDPSRTNVRQLARAVAEKVFEPLQSLLADDQRLLISPDGQLNLIPFEVLLDGQGRYLVKRFSISYLTTGRDLLRMQVPRSSGSTPVLVADPLFREPDKTPVPSAALTPARSGGARTARRSVTTGADFSSLYFAPLAGTKAEARSIQALFPEARVLTGEQASEAALEQLNAPKILHIATHGFFLQDASQQTKASGNGAQSAATGDIDNPLLRSGLALSGANLVKDGRGEGIVTALEASNLNLWGTKLVTLSACDTGVGEVRNREGVYGLRRAFFLAGAESLVMSLWPVSDYVTREMMAGYYRGLKQGLGRGDALRRVQLGMLKRKNRQHPFYWASFIQSGEWANLDGQR